RNSQSIFSTSCTSSCFMLMIWSSRPRNRSLDPVVSCFFGRMLPSAAATESQLPIRGNPRNEIASFRGFEPQKLAFSNRRIGGKQTLAQGLTSCSRPTKSCENDRILQFDCGALCPILFLDCRDCIGDRIRGSLQVVLGMQRR